MLLVPQLTAAEDKLLSEAKKKKNAECMRRMERVVSRLSAKIDDRERNMLLARLNAALEMVEVTQIEIKDSEQLSQSLQYMNEILQHCPDVTNLSLLYYCNPGKGAKTLYKALRDFTELKCVELSYLAASRELMAALATVKIDSLVIRCPTFSDLEQKINEEDRDQEPNDYLLEMELVLRAHSKIIAETLESEPDWSSIQIEPFDHVVEETKDKHDLAVPI